MKTVIRQKIVVTTFHNSFLPNYRFQFYDDLLHIDYYYELQTGTGRHM